MIYQLFLYRQHVDKKLFVARVLISKAFLQRKTRSKIRNNRRDSDN